MIETPRRHGQHPVHTRRWVGYRAKAAARWAMLGTLALLTFGLNTSAHALGKAQTAAVQARFAQERNACLSGASGQDRDTCLREAAAARAEALRGGLNDGDARYKDNQRLRCAALPASEQPACNARMQGQGSVSGSVAGGGLLRELVITERGSPAGAAAAPAPAGAAPAPAAASAMPAPTPSR